jgi:hypothetical protein
MSENIVNNLLGVKKGFRYICSCETCWENGTFGDWREDFDPTIMGKGTVVINKCLLGHVVKTVICYDNVVYDQDGWYITLNELLEVEKERNKREGSRQIGLLLKSELGWKMTGGERRELVNFLKKK